MGKIIPLVVIALPQEVVHPEDRAAEYLLLVLTNDISVKDEGVPKPL